VGTPTHFPYFRRQAGDFPDQARKVQLRRKPDTTSYQRLLIENRLPG
jgi:hypothetical protein